MKREKCIYRGGGGGVLCKESEIREFKKIYWGKGARFYVTASKHFITLVAR